MTFVALRRLGSAVVAVGLTVVLSAGLTVALSGAPAGAAQLRPEINSPNLALPVGPVGRSSWVYLTDPHMFTLHDVTVTIDATKAASVATFDVIGGDADPCTAAGAVITCTFGTLASEQTSYDGFAYIASLEVKPTATAKLNDEGTFTVRVSSRESSSYAKTSQVTIAEKVTLGTDDTVRSVSLAPGAKVPTRLQVTNEGTNAIDAVDLVFDAPPWFTLDRAFTNCEYGMIARFATVQAVCHLTGPLQPGVSYDVSAALPIAVRRDMSAPAVIGTDFSWLTPTDNRDTMDLMRQLKAQGGKGTPLRLVRRASPAAKNAQTTDLPFAPTQSVIVNVTGIHSSDTAALGARASGKVGRTVKVKIGVQNLGPALVMGFPDPAATVTFTPPSGTSVVSVPTDCVLKKKTYVCTTTVSPFNVKQSVRWQFSLWVGKSGHRRGKVVVTTSGVDPKSANNTAKVQIN